MKLYEVLNAQPTAGYKTYLAKVRLTLTGYKQIIDAQVTARDLNGAIKLLKATYGKDSLIGTPRPIGTDRK